MTNKNFSWRKDTPAPLVRPHSLKKLDVIEQYVRIYLKTRAANPRIDNIPLSLVDTFCGGGVYRNDISGKVELGSPLRLVNAVRATESELAAERRKSFKILATFFFSDAAREHVACLKSEIENSPFRDEIGKSIHLKHGRSSDVLADVVSRIGASRGNTRSLFVMDQCGYKDVPMRDIQMILQRLPNAEIILTFSIDALLNFLTEKREPSETIRDFGVDRDFFRSWRQGRHDDARGRAYAQKHLMSNLRKQSGAQFFTPFLLFSTDESRTIMLAHLSRHQKARDKMLGIHWDQQNSFHHYGSGSFYELAYDPRRIDYDDDLFSFRPADKQEMQRQLENELPDRLFSMMNDHGITVEELLFIIGNETAARNDDIFDALGQMIANRDVQVRGSTFPKRRPRLGDQIIKPPQGRFVFVGGKHQ